MSFRRRSRPVRAARSGCVRRNVRLMSNGRASSGRSHGSASTGFRTTRTPPPVMRLHREALPEEEMEALRRTVASHGAPELIGFHKLRARRAGSRRYIDLHLQFRDGTSLRRAHEISHELQRAIGDQLRGADVLIHLEPEEAADPPSEEPRERSVAPPAERA